MIRKNDVREIRNLLNDVKNVTISRMKGAYVSANKEIITRIDESFLSLPEEEFYKYLDIAKEVFQPNKMDDKNLELEFDSGESEVRKLLTILVKSGLKDDAMLENFYKRIIEDYDMVGNFMILLFHDCYDVMKKTSDGNKLDESEEVYQYIICAICPVTLDKPGLQYDGADNYIRPKRRNWILQKPAVGFVYPAFEERSANEEKVLYYCQKPKEPAHELIECVLECRPVLTATEHREEFENMVLRVVESIELKEDFLGRMNSIFQEMLLDELVDCTAEPKRLTDLELLDIALKAQIPEYYAEKMSKEFGKKYARIWPKLEWIYDEKMCAVAHEKQRKERVRNMLSRASRALGGIGQKDLAEEIDQYLEKSR